MELYIYEPRRRTFPTILHVHQAKSFRSACASAQSDHSSLCTVWIAGMRLLLGDFRFFWLQNMFFNITLLCLKIAKKTLLESVTGVFRFFT